MLNGTGHTVKPGEELTCRYCDGRLEPNKLAIVHHDVLNPQLPIEFNHPTCEAQEILHGIYSKVAQTVDTQDMSLTRGDINVGIIDFPGRLQKRDPAWLYDALTALISVRCHLSSYEAEREIYRFVQDC